MITKTTLQKLLILSFIGSQISCTVPALKESKKVEFKEKQDYKKYFVLLIAISKEAGTLALKVYEGNLDDMRDLYDFDAQDKLYAFVIIDQATGEPVNFIASSNFSELQLEKVRCPKVFEAKKAGTLDGAKLTIETGSNANEKIMILKINYGGVEKNIAVLFRTDLAEEGGIRRVSRNVFNTIKGFFVKQQEASGTEAPAIPAAGKLTNEDSTYVPVDYCYDHTYAKEGRHYHPVAFVLNGETEKNIQLNYGILSIGMDSNDIKSVEYVPTIKRAFKDNPALPKTNVTFTEVPKNS